MRVDLTPAAWNDIRLAHLWYRDQGGRAAADFKNDLHATLRRLGRNPLVYARIDGEVRRVILRRFPYGIFYKVTTQSDIVFRVFHTHRDPEVWQSRSGGNLLS